MKFSLLSVDSVDLFWRTNPQNRLKFQGGNFNFIFLPWNLNFLTSEETECLNWLNSQTKNFECLRSNVAGNGADPLPTYLFLRSLLYRRLPVNLAKYFSQSTSGRLLLINILLFTERTSARKCYSWPVFLNFL